MAFLDSNKCAFITMVIYVATTQIRILIYVCDVWELHYV